MYNTFYFMYKIKYKVGYIINRRFNMEEDSKLVFINIEGIIKFLKPLIV